MPSKSHNFESEILKFKATIQFSILFEEFISRYNLAIYNLYELLQLTEHSMIKFPILYAGDIFEIMLKNLARI